MITSTADTAATPEAVPQPLGRGMGAAGRPAPWTACTAIGRTPSGVTCLQYRQLSVTSLARSMVSESEPT